MGHRRAGAGQKEHLMYEPPYERKEHGLLNPSKEACISSEQGKAGETQRLKKSRSVSMESKQKAITADLRNGGSWGPGLHASP